MIDQNRMAAFIDANRKAIIDDFARPDTRCSALSRWSRWIFDSVIVPDPKPVPAPVPGVSILDDNEADFPPLDGDGTGEWANGGAP